MVVSAVLMVFGFLVLMVFRVMGKLQDCVQGSLYFKHASICIPLRLRKLVDLYGLIYLVVC